MKIILTIILGIIPLLGFTQEQFVISLNEFQYTESSGSSMQTQIRFPTSEKVIFMGGLDHLDEIGKYFNIYGSKLKVDNLTMNGDGTHTVILRREDGKNFFDLFPKLTARLIPVSHSDFEKELYQKTEINTEEE